MILPPPDGNDFRTESCAVVESGTYRRRGVVGGYSVESVDKTFLDVLGACRSLPMICLFAVVLRAGVVRPRLYFRLFRPNPSHTFLFRMSLAGYNLPYGD